MKIPEHIWKPVDAERDKYGSVQIVYKNELGEEYVYSPSISIDVSRDTCWPICSRYGDWPGCKFSCPLFNLPREQHVSPLGVDQSFKADEPSTPIDGVLSDRNSFEPVDMQEWIEGHYAEEADKEYPPISMADGNGNRPISELGSDHIAARIDWQPCSTLYTNEFDDYMESWKGRCGEKLWLYLNAQLIEQSPRLQDFANELNMLYTKRKDHLEAYEEILGGHYYVKWVDGSLVQGFTAKDHIHHMRIFPCDWLDESILLTKRAERIYRAYVKRLHQIWDDEKPDAFIHEEAYENNGIQGSNRYHVYWNDGSMYEYWEGSDDTQYVNEYRNNRLMHDLDLYRKAHVIYSRFKKTHPGPDNIPTIYY